MSFYSNKEKMEGNDYKDICRNHSAKTDREMFRVCPSKLCKRELEDLYFTVLENNLELKKTINGQQDKIRLLSTQVQRMTNTQERLVSKEMKDRGTVTKAIVDEQKDFISELKETNQRLTDRIQQLNMRLCSAKQFVKTTPPQPAPFRGNRSGATAVSTPKKHDCLSKSPDSSPEQVVKVSTFSQWEEKTPRKNVQTQNNVAVDKRPLKSDQLCDENKCRTLMEELKLKIVTLQEELLNVHGEYATRIGRLETEVMDVRQENIRVISERSASEVELTNSCKRANALLEHYRSFEAKCAELTTELAIEKRKVAELETQLKAAKMSDKVNKTIEDHLTTKQETSGATDGGPRVTPRGGRPKDVSSPDRKRDAGLPSGKLRDAGPRDGSPRDAKPLNAGQPDGGLRDGKPLNAGPPDGGLRDGGPQNETPKANDPQDGIPLKCYCGCPPSTPQTPPPPPTRDVNEKTPTKETSGATDRGPRVTPRGGRPKDVSSPDRKRDAGLPSGKLRDGGPRDGSPRDAKPLNSGQPDGGLRDGKPLNAGPPDGGLRDGGPQNETPKANDPQDGIPLKCYCGCSPSTPQTPPPPPTRDVNEKALTKTVPPIVPPKKRDGLDDTSAKSSPTKYSSTKSCSSGSKYSSSYTTTTSGNGKCIMCGNALPAPSPSPAAPPKPSSPPPPSPLPRPPAPENTSTPIKEKKNTVECRCPAWIQDGLSNLSSPNAANQKCVKCCFKDKPESEIPPSKTDDLPPSAGVSSNKGDPNSTSSHTGDDSGYQDTEQALIKQNKELMAKVLDLQRQVDCMKIGEFCGMPECQSESLSELERSPTKSADNSIVTSASPLVVDILKPSELSEDKPNSLGTKDTASVNLPLPGDSQKPSELPQDKPDKPNSPDTKDTASVNLPLPGDSQKAETSVEQIEQLPKGDNHKRIISVESEQHVDLSNEKRVETLGNPEETCTASLMQRRTSEDTRARIVEDVDGTQYIVDHASKVPDKYGYPDIPNYEYRECDSRDSPKFKIVEKRRLEGSTVAIMPRNAETKNTSLKSLSLGPGFNPEKLKYLEAEGLTTETPRVSLGSVPSNPELGCIPRLTTKPDQVKNKAESGSPITSNPTIQKTRDSTLPRELGRETLLPSHSIAPVHTDDTHKDEDCQYCAACSFDKECAHTNQTSMNKLAIGMQKEHARKHDQHNSLQIPGPIHPLDNGKKEKKRSLICHFKKQEKENQSAEKLIVNPKVYARQTSLTVGGPVRLPDVPLLEKREESTNDYIIGKGSEIDQKRLTQNKKDKSRKRRKGNQTKDDLIVNPRTLAQQTCETAGGPVNLPDVPLLEKAVEEKSKYEPGKYSNDGKTGTKQNHTEKSSQAPGYRAWQGDVSLYRRRSGTYCFRRGLQTQGPLVCRCASHHNGACPLKPRNKGTQVADNPENTSPKEKRRAVSMSDRGTYTLESKPTATSPDNTDLEMSYLSDLPMEKEKKSPLKSRPLSPGEDKTTTYTSTSYGTSAPTSLSEGEMPTPATKLRLSEPVRDSIYVNSTLAHKVETPPTQQMEAALQAITVELQRCKHLLQRHRPENVSRHSSELTSCSAQTSATNVSRPISLKAAAAQRGIGDTQPPMSVFTLHIGTVVFSDEAVLSSRDKNLVLKWKFYDQAVTMARMRAGRVMLFDFSTEYDVKVTEDFLNYLKHEEMPIVICELNHEEQPFASCALPLRDALLHTNTRADMSIALVAGPQMLNARTTSGVDALDNRNEIGVIDLWCMLRTESTTAPGINLAIGQPGTLMTMEKCQSPQKLQGGDDSNELELSMLRSGPAATCEQTGKNQTYADVGYSRPSDTWSYRQRTRPSVNLHPASLGSAKEGTYDARKYPPLRQRKSALASPGKKLSPDKVSDLIFREVKPMIKTPGDVKYVMQKNSLLNDPKYRNNSPSEHEVDSSAYQENRSYGSLRSVLSRLHKKGSPHTQTHGGDQHNFIAKLRKASPSRTDQSKKVTIQPKYFASEVEKPQRDTEEPTVQDNREQSTPKLEITILWLALNEKCDAMCDPRVQRVYVAYSFLGRSGADLETPVSLPKPRHYVEKCYFNFKKVFELEEADFPRLGHMARCRNSNVSASEKDCIIFTVVSEPAEDPLGIESCEDIGYAYLYLGDLLAYSSGSPGYTEVMPVRAARGEAPVCGVLAVRLDGLDVVQRCLHLARS